MPDENRGNPYRCQECGNLAGSDNWCKLHRPSKINNRFPVRRDNFIQEYGARNVKNWKGPFPSEFKARHKEYLITRKGYGT